MPDLNQPAGFTSGNAIKLDSPPAQPAPPPVPAEPSSDSPSMDVRPNFGGSQQANAAGNIFNAAAPVVEAKPDGPLADADKKDGAKTDAADIYAMPKEYQHHNRVAGGNTKLKGALVILASFLFLVVVGGGLYLYFFNPLLLDQLLGRPTLIPAPVTEPLAAQSGAMIGLPAESTSTAPTAAPVEMPTQVYKRYIQRLAQVATFNDYAAAVNEFGSQQKMAEVDSQKLSVQASADAEIAGLQKIKESTPLFTGQEAFTEKINGSTAALSVVLADNRGTGTVQFILENNLWKIGTEQWSLVTPAAGTVSYSLGTDRDGDGLTDSEEALVGSDKNNIDTDGDGFNDLSETLSLYNPAGKNKLVDNANIKVYIADDKSFSFLYPAKWERVSSNKDESLVFRSSADDHFVQLMVLANDQKESLDAYVKRTLNIVSIKDGMRRTSDTWQGVMTDDGLEIFMISQKNTSKIYVMRYSPSDTVLEYPNIFKAMVKSFVIK